MEKNKNNMALLSVVLVPVTFLILWIYGQIEKNGRKPLACEGQPNCVDLRGLGNLYLAFLFIAFVAAIGTAIAFNAKKKNQKFAMAALIINALLTVAFIIATVSSYMSSH